MDTFLGEVARTVYDQYKNDLGNVAIVFPNRRPMVFFRKYLEKIIDAPTWEPQYFTIQELMGNLSGLQTEDNLSLIFKLHEVYSRKKKQAEPLDSFLFWGEMLLSDFDDLDKFLVEPRDLFRNLMELKTYEGLFNYLSEKQIKAIQAFWSSFSPEKTTAEQRSFIDTWNILHPVYVEFTQLLLSEKTGYEGLIFRNVARLVQNSPEIINLPAAKLIFVGFNAINACEERLFTWLKRIQKADFFWDVNDHYLHAEHHQAGRFLRKNLQDFPHPDYARSYLSTAHAFPIKLTSYSTDFNTAQPAICSHLLTEMIRNGNKPGVETAVILGDEDLMFPLLHQLPAEVDKINVTMGYPLKSSNTYGYTQELLNLVKSVQDSSKGRKYYYKPIINLLRHPFSLQMEPELCLKLQKTLFSKNRFVVQEEDTGSYGRFKSWFTPVNSGKELFEYLQIHLEETGRYIIDNSAADMYLEVEFIYAAQKALTRLYDVIRVKEDELQVSTCIRLITKVMQTISVPFNGEPLNGIQIMGVLESRSLDFENLIFLSLNEGNFPKRAGAPSYIPDNLRFAFNIPTYDHQDSIFTYYFYRLMHRSQNVSFIYSTRTDGMRTGEKSRFLYQLEMLENLEISHQHLNFPLKVDPPPVISITKDEAVQQLLKKYSGEGNEKLSPSALNVFIDCSLRFYFRYVAGLKEPDEMKETIDPPSFGNILHAAIEALYQDYVGKAIDGEQLKRFAEDDALLDNVLIHAYSVEYLKAETDKTPEGADVLVFEVLKKYLKQILSYDRQAAPIKIISLENEYMVKVSLPDADILSSANIGGKIDRIDQVGEFTRIIDYKTGKAENKITFMDALFAKDDKNRNKAGFQTFLYAFLYQKNTTLETRLLPGLYTIRELTKEDFDYRMYFQPPHKEKNYITDFTALADEFEQLLKECLSDLFRSDVPFTQTDNQDYCRYCPYASICERG